jgi:hypothetical protein
MTKHFTRDMIRDTSDIRLLWRFTGRRPQPVSRHKAQFDAMTEANHEAMQARLVALSKAKAPKPLDTTLEGYCLGKYTEQDMLLAEEATQPEQLYYLSFADPGEFLGGCVVMARGIATAIDRTYELGINPGGSVRCCAISRNTLPLNRLLSRAELESPPEKAA